MPPLASDIGPRGTKYAWLGCASALALGVFVGCGAPPKPLETADDRVEVGSAKTHEPQGDPRRTPSEALQVSWPFDDPDVALYVDVNGFRKTKLVRDVALGIVREQLGMAQRACFDAMADGVLEFAAGNDDRGFLSITRLKEARPGWVDGCVAAVYQTRAPLTLDGATEGWVVDNARNHVACLTRSGLFLEGERRLVERALRGRQRGRTLSMLALGTDEYVAGQAKLRSQGITWRGTVLLHDERFRVSAEADFPTDTAAQAFKRAFSSLNVRSAISSIDTTPEVKDHLVRLTRAFSIADDGRHLVATFDLRAPTSEQALILEMAAHLVRPFVLNLFLRARERE